MELYKIEEFKQQLRELLINGHYTKEIQNKALENPFVKELCVYINNLCNLNCKHCSYCIPSGTQYLHKPELTEQEFADFISEHLGDNDSGVVAFAGREPFFNDKIIKVLDKLDNLIENGGKFRYGVVSNGTLIKPYFQELKQNKNLNWIDISLDGDEKTHDFIRGQGVYKKAIESLKGLVDEKVVKFVGISTCCYKGNYPVLPVLFEKLYYEIGLKNICVLPYVYTGKNQKEFISSRKEFMEFYKKLINDEKLSKLPLNLLFDFEWFTIPFVQELYKNNLISMDDLKLDKEGTPYIAFKKGKMSIYLKFTMLEFNRFLLFPDGYFGTMFISETQKYYELATCNIKDKKIDKEVLKETLRRQFTHFNKNLKQHKEVLLSEI